MERKKVGGRERKLGFEIDSMTMVVLHESQTLKDVEKTRRIKSSERFIGIQLFF